MAVEAALHELEGGVEDEKRCPLLNDDGLDVGGVAGKYRGCVRLGDVQEPDALEVGALCAEACFDAAERVLGGEEDDDGGGVRAGDLGGPGRGDAAFAHAGVAGQVGELTFGQEILDHPLDGLLDGVAGADEGDGAGRTGGRHLAIVVRSRFPGDPVTWPGLRR